MNQNKKMSDYKSDIIKKKYGRNASPLLIADKSPEGLIKANCKPKEWSLLQAFKIFAV
jgi:hypothetical protein